ncbi:MAG: DUF401 family protein [Spirochaetes bacterium]|nr:DUF401 family protein [Spirochaetota bacterium]
MLNNMFFFNVPVTIKLVSALVLILAINRILKNLLVSISSGIVILILWLRFSPGQVFEIFSSKLCSLNSIMLLLVIYAITVLSNVMSETGMMKKLVNAVNSLVSPVSGMAVLPAMIGLLPIPGGAIFSAPLVADCDGNNEVDAILKTKINYWFRHIWEFWWPLYPGVLLAINLSGLKTIQYAVLMSPLTLFAVFGGYFFLLRKVKIQQVNRINSLSRFTVLLNIFRQIYPVMIVILLFASFNFLFPEISAVSSYVPMLAAVFISICMLCIIEKPGIFILKKNMLNKKNIDLIFLVIVILLYGAVIESRLPSGNHLMNQVRQEITSAGIPVLIIISVLPFISGLSTGISLALVGASFPIVTGIIPQGISNFQYHACILLAAGSGFIGMILSPVHICLIVTNNYFKSSLTVSILRLIKPAMIIAAGIAVMFFIYYFIPG